jgi:hypothetical protein
MVAAGRGGAPSASQEVVMASRDDLLMLVAGAVAGAVLLGGSVGILLLTGIGALPVFTPATVEGVPEGARLAWFAILHIVPGTATVWLYSAMQKEDEQAAATAVAAGGAVWFLAVAVPSAFNLLLGSFRPSVVGPAPMFVSLALYFAAAAAGVALYRRALAYEREAEIAAIRD